MGYLLLLWNSSFLLSTLIHSSIIVRSELSSPLHFIHPRETKLCYLHLPLWLFGIKIISLSPSLSFNALFPLVIFGWIFPDLYYLFVSLLKNCSCIEGGDTYFRALRAHITC